MLLPVSTPTTTRPSTINFSLVCDGQQQQLCQAKRSRNSKSDESTTLRAILVPTEANFNDYEQGRTASTATSNNHHHRNSEQRQHKRSKSAQASANICTTIESRRSSFKIELRYNDSFWPTANKFCLGKFCDTGTQSHYGHA